MYDAKFNFSLDALKAPTNTLYVISTVCSYFREPLTHAMTRRVSPVVYSFKDTHLAFARHRWRFLNNMSLPSVRQIGDTIIPHLSGIPQQTRSLLHGMTRRASKNSFVNEGRRRRQWFSRRPYWYKNKWIIVRLCSHHTPSHIDNQNMCKEKQRRERWRVRSCVPMNESCVREKQAMNTRSNRVLRQPQFPTPTSSQISRDVYITSSIPFVRNGWCIALLALNLWVTDWSALEFGYACSWRCDRSLHRESILVSLVIILIDVPSAAGRKRFRDLYVSACY
jgi:hypothetical protein